MRLVVREASARAGNLCLSPAERAAWQWIVEMAVVCLRNSPVEDRISAETSTHPTTKPNAR